MTPQSQTAICLKPSCDGQNGNHRSAYVDEIVDGIQIHNGAEGESVYSAVDPYTDGTAKRDDTKPLIFCRISPGIYEFLGFDGDPLDLTKKFTFRCDRIREAYRVFSDLIREWGMEARFKNMSASERIRLFHATLKEQPALLDIADEELRAKQSLAQLRLD
jgi:hypothetical protein